MSIYENSASNKKRRSRSVSGNRNHICGCGKTYKSYPALYTHIKNKHEGIFPEGSNLRRKLDKKNVKFIAQNFGPKFYLTTIGFVELCRGLEITLQG
jgi:hypothetical protein